MDRPKPIGCPVFQMKMSGEIILIARKTAIDIAVVNRRHSCQIVLELLVLILHAKLGHSPLSIHVLRRNDEYKRYSVLARIFHDRPELVAKAARIRIPFVLASQGLKLDPPEGIPVQMSSEVRSMVENSVGNIVGSGLQNIRVENIEHRDLYDSLRLRNSIRGVSVVSYEIYLEIDVFQR